MHPTFFRTSRIASEVLTVSRVRATSPALFAAAFKSSAAARLKLPARVHGVDGRYAEALYSAAAKQQLLDRVEQDMKKLSSVFRTDARFKELMTHPKASRLIKVEDMKAILARLDLSPPSNNLLILLTENRRLSILEKIIEGYAFIMTAYRGEILCEVTSAEPLTEPVKEKIKAGLDSAYKKRRKVSIVNIVKPEIIGGLILKVDDYHVDMSISTKLAKFERLLSASLLV